MHDATRSEIPCHPAKGGDPILFEHLFWIYSHPAVYVMIIPAMGVISEVIPAFARRDIFGYTAIAMSSMAIAIIGYLVWGHHMFTSGMSDTARVTFSLPTFLVAVPNGVKVFNWVASLHRGSIELASPMLFALAFIVLFSIGGLTGLVNGALATNIHIHGTYFIVAHFHYTMFGGTAFAFFAGLHYWFPKITGRMYAERLAKIAWGVMLVGFNVLYFRLKSRRCGQTSRPPKIQRLLYDDALPASRCSPATAFAAGLPDPAASACPLPAETDRGRQGEGRCIHQAQHFGQDACGTLVVEALLGFRRRQGAHTFAT